MMSLRNAVTLLIWVAFGAFQVVRAQTTEELNLGFEQVAGTPSKPKAWATSGDGFATDAPGYEVGLDEAESRSGQRSLRMKSAGQGSFGNAYLTIPGNVAAGKHVKISAWIKTKDVAPAGYAGLWCRLDGSGGMLARDNSVARIDARGKTTIDDRGIRGTTEWTLRSVEHDVPSSARAIVFGALLVGKGTAWWDDFAVEIDGKPYRGKPLAELAAERAPKLAELEWLRKNAIAFKTERAESGFDDLQPLKALVGGARIVGLGEATHGTAEFFRMKHRLVEFLASEMGFTAFAIEANMPEAFRVNDYVLHGKGDPKALLRGMYFWTWETQEVLDMILWMRRFNESGKGRIQFLGFDMQTAAVAAENALKCLTELDPDFAKAAAEAYDGLDEAIGQARASNASQKTFAAKAVTRLANVARRTRVDAVLKHMEEARGRYVETKPAAEVDWAIQNARVAAQAAGFMVASSLEGSAHRDRCMADNVDWILAQVPAGSRVVLWAHNGHVSKTGMGSTSMGSHLAKRHGKDYVVLGFAAHQGRYTAVGPVTGLGTHVAQASRLGSVEYYAHASGLPRMIIDLRRASKDDPASAWLTKALDHRSIGALAYDRSYPSVLSEEYDALIVFDDTTASKCLRFATPAWTPTADVSPPDTSRWKVLFADAFDRESLGEAWAPRTGAWSVDGGKLKGVLESSLAGGRSDAWVALNGRTLPARVEVRFDCRTSAPLILITALTNERRDGVAVELRGTAESDLLSVDGRPGQKAAVVRGHLNEFLAGNPAFALEPNKSYRVAIVRDAGRVTVVVDNRVVVTADVGAGESPENGALSFVARSGKAGTALILDRLEILTP
jgi:erythromycin esterase